MPQKTIFQVCSQKNDWTEFNIPSSSDPEKSYAIKIPPWGVKNPQEIVCDCPGYQYRNYCNHQQLAFNNICNWNSVDGQEQSPAEQKLKKCPICGGPTETWVVDD